MLRDEEAAPKSATQINVLSSVPPTRAEVALAGTEQAISTAVGMQPPSAQPSAVPAAALVPITASGRPVIGNAVGATALGGAATLASEPGAGLDLVPLAAPANAPAKPLVDREAATHASGALGVTQRLAQNDTAMDDGLTPLAPPDAVRAALAQREPLELPPTSNAPLGPLRPDIVFPPSPQGFSTGTGPLSGEARTRPPAERGMLLPLLAAASFGALLVGGAVLLVTKPWVKAAGAPPPPVVVTAPAPRPTLPPPAADPPASAPLAVAAPSAAPAAPPASATTGKALSVPVAEPAARPTRGQGRQARPDPAPLAVPTAVTPAPPASTPAAPPAATPRKPQRPPKPEDVGFE